MSKSSARLANKKASSSQKSSGPGRVDMEIPKNPKNRTISPSIKEHNIGTGSQDYSVSQQSQQSLAEIFPTEYEREVIVNTILGPNDVINQDSHVNVEESARIKYIKNQQNNRYSVENGSSYLVFIESLSEDSEENIGNLHPNTIGQKLYKRKMESKYKYIYDNILNFSRKGKKLISIEFRTMKEANKFLDHKELIPENWFAYIPNFKIFRTGIIKDVSIDLSETEILEGIEFPNNSFKITKIERLKFLDRRNNNSLKPSNSVKITFETSLLPEFVYIYRYKHRVLPFINKPRKCTKFCRWGHSDRMCRGKVRCSRCGEDHPIEECTEDTYKCVNCGGPHSPFERSCPSFQYQNLIAHVMAYVNCSNFKARRILKNRDISDISQISQMFRSQAYAGWNSRLELGRSHGHNENTHREDSLEGLKRGPTRIFRGNYTENARKNRIPDRSASNITNIQTAPSQESLGSLNRHKDIRDRRATRVDSLISLAESHNTADGQGSIPSQSQLALPPSGVLLNNQVINVDVLFSHINRLLSSDSSREEKWNEFNYYMIASKLFKEP
ncbi:uncharacterized protein LOC118646829 [Monomorium pharaonis]|uniref:uncharacterized protein LOC118646829 n=1 Tax=Monomorium pharaonis TaxID=307658 RepID=UPI001746676E|nr:uncharacterized protein LOC118646829 [Monomorium pharaonis]